jgi:hypothetical protein
LQGRLSPKDPQYWLGRAEQARRHAARVKDLEIKSLWLRIADGHERQAELLERLRHLANKPPDNRGPD